MSSWLANTLSVAARDAPSVRCSKQRTAMESDMDSMNLARKIDPVSPRKNMESGHPVRDLGVYTLRIRVEVGPLRPN